MFKWLMNDKLFCYDDHGADESLNLAREAFVFMVVALKDSWKMPVVYFLSDSLGGEKRTLDPTPYSCTMLVQWWQL